MAAAPKNAREQARKLIAENRQARRNYEIEEVYEAGIMLLGTEVKSLRAGRANIAESYAREEDGEIILVNASIPIYPPAAQFNHEPGRKRKLLLKKKEMAKLILGIDKEGRTLVPLKMYFNDRGLAKIELGLGRGRKNIDKRDLEKARDWDRQKGRLLRDRG
ncbi:MAG: SsrA-binding protein SmpB [Alphaproteobacteria bacterium]|nr:SsrA-binding protein SmpB [Alphaproteobacteria bacterium]